MQTERKSKEIFSSVPQYEQRLIEGCLENEVQPRHIHSSLYRDLSPE